MKVSAKAVSGYEGCFKLMSKIATFRNNVSAHVNNKRTEADWAQFAGIRNGELDVFIQNARMVVAELGRANIGIDFVPSSHLVFHRDFHELCQIMAEKP